MKTPGMNPFDRPMPPGNPFDDAVKSPDDHAAQRKGDARLPNAADGTTPASAATQSVAGKYPGSFKT